MHRQGWCSGVPAQGTPAQPCPLVSCTLDLVRFSLLASASQFSPPESGAIGAALVLCEIFFSFSLD